MSCVRRNVRTSVLACVCATARGLRGLCTRMSTHTHTHTHARARAHTLTHTLTHTRAHCTHARSVLTAHTHTHTGACTMAQHTHGHTPHIAAESVMCTHLSLPAASCSARMFPPAIAPPPAPLSAWLTAFAPPHLTHLAFWTSVPLQPEKSRERQRGRRSMQAGVEHASML